MGTLETIGVISDGDITQAAATKYRDNVVNTLNVGISLGSVSLAAGSIDMGSFGEDPIGIIQEQFPAWYGVYVNGFLKNIALLLDLIPDAAILTPVVDPTKPVAIVISELQETLLAIEAAIGIPVVDVLISQIDVVVQKSSEISVAIESEDSEAFYDALVSTIVAAFEAEGLDTAQIIEKLDERKSDIENLANTIIEESKLEISNIVPDLPIPSLDISFIDPELDPSPLFATIEADGFDGIATKFIKAMTVFLSIPSKIAEAIAAAADEVKKILDAIEKLLTNFAEAIVELIEAVIDFVWSLISQVISILSVAFLEISSILNIVFFFAKCFVVVLIGFLLGSGMIALAAAKSLEII